MLTKIIIISFLQDVFRQDVFTADALKVNGDMSQMSSLSKKAVDISDQCQVAGHDVDSIVKSVSTFFGQKNIPVYPWAITMVAAMRWGGAGINLKEGEFILDHDLDFLVATPSQSLADCEKLVKEWQSYLYTNFGLSSYVDSVALNNPGLSSNKFFRASDTFHFFMVVRKSTGVGDKFAKDNILSRTFDKIHQVQTYMYTKGGEFHTGDSSHDVSSDNFKFSEWMADPNNPFDSRGVTHTEQSWGQAKSEMLKDWENSETAQNGFTFVDLWFKPSKDLSKSLKPSQTKQTLFNGEVFPFPEDQDYVLSDLRETFLPNHPAYNTSMCDFYKPHGLFEEDMLGSEEVVKITTDCASALAKRSFASFQSICPNGVQ